MKKAVLQIKDKGGSRIERVSIGDEGISIGRAWNNDVILQDRFVDPGHLHVSLGDDDTLLITDRSSTNGSSIAGKRIKEEAAQYRLGETIRLGDSQIKIVDHSIDVEATSLRSGWYLLSEKFNGGVALLMLTLVTIGCELLVDWLFTAKPLKLNTLLVAMVALLVVLIIWSLLLAFVAKLVRGESDIRSFWVLGCIGVILFNVATFVMMVWRFNVQNQGFGTWLTLIGLSAICIWMLAGVLSYTTHLSDRVKWLGSALVVITFFGLLGSEEWLKDDHEKWSGFSRNEKTTMPPAFLMKGLVTVDAYQQQTDSLFEFNELDE